MRMPASLGLLASVLVAVTVTHGARSQPGSVSQPAPSGAPSAWQWPERMKNARVLDRNIGRDGLRDIMRSFAVQLGVRCTYCHTGAPDAALGQIDFASDANPRKEIARSMFRMVEQLNRRSLPRINGLADPRVTCFTCHRGSAIPARLPAAS